MPTRRLIIYYVLLVLSAVVVTVVTLSAGSRVDAAPSIAGGYDVEDAGDCLDRRFELRQSGQFVDLEHPDGERAGRLRFRDGRLTGTVSCIDGDSAELDARVADDALSGAIGGEPVRAVFVREPAAGGGGQQRPPGSLAGEYGLIPPSACLGGSLELEGDRRVELAGRDPVHGEGRYGDGRFSAEVTCADGGRAEVTGTASGQEIALTVTREAAGSQEEASERVVAEHEREFGHTLALFFAAVTVVMLAARLAGAVAARLGQPRVMGEVAAGIILGPTVLGALLPGVQSAIFPSDVIPFIGVAANLGLIFYMFLVGLELDVSALRGRVAQTAAISNTGVAIPMMVGLAVAIPTYELVGPDRGFTGFALFMGVSMSITAFPVLARILVERRMLKRPLGVLALASAAIDDVTAWFLIALATAVAVAGSPSGVVRTIALAVAFCVFMALVARPLVARVSVAFDEAGRVPVGWITALFAGVLMSAYITETIGIALIFGAFIMGAIMPRHAGLTEDVTRRIEDFVLLLLLPLFFAYTGLRTNVGLLDRPALVLLTLALIAAAIACKFGGTMLAARITGLRWRESAMLGALMNTRGLTELIVLNLALEKGIISEALFAALVLMALVTTFMAGPVLRLLDPRNEFGASIEEELEDARRDTAEISPVPLPERSILVAPQTDAAVPQLIGLAEPLTRSQPPRELILARLVPPPGGASARGGLQTEQRRLQQAGAELTRIRGDLLSRGVPSRAVAFSSPSIGRDLARLAESEEVDLVLADGRRPLLGEGVPRGDVGTLLSEAPSDVAVLVAREDAGIRLSADAPVIVPFGGAEHDWAALELGAWLASAHGAPLQLLGAEGRTEDGRDASRLLGNASLLVQRFVGVAAEPVIVEGRSGVIDAAGGAGLLAIGLSDRWQEEGLGPTRREIAAAAPAPILFVRRGTRPGALAPRNDVTRFTWSAPAVGLR